MPLNAEAKLLSNDYLAKGLLEDDPRRLQFMNVLPMYQLEGNSLRYPITDTLDLGETIGFCDPITDITAIPGDDPDFRMAELATHFEVSYKGQDVFCETNDQYVTQRGLAIRQLLYRFADMFVTGDDPINPDDFKGLNRIGGQTIDLAGAPLTIEDLDKAKGKVRTNNGFCGVIFTNQLGYERIRRVYYNVGTKPQRAAVMAPCPVNGNREQDVTAIDGWPIYINDLQPTGTIGPTTVTDIYFAVLGWNNLHGIIPACAGDSMFKERKTIRPDDSKDVGHMVFPVGLALGTPAALVRLKDVGPPAGGT